MVCVAPVKPSQASRPHDDNYMDCVALVKPSRLAAFRHNNCKRIYDSHQITQSVTTISEKPLYYRSSQPWVSFEIRQADSPL
jgi:hypothetical protein